MFGQGGWQQMVTHIVSILSLFFITIAVTTGQDPCDSYTNKPDDFWRSTNYLLPPPALHGALHCDDHIDDQKWYRFNGPAGNDMPQTCPERQRCGTYFPIWLDGSLPTSDDGVVVRDACVKFLGCCDLIKQVSIRNCTEFNVYKFSKSAGCCPCSYCIGEQVKCPDGKNSPNGFTSDDDPNCDKWVFPNMTTAPAIGVEADNVVKQMVFTCTPNFVGEDGAQFVFSVIWKFDTLTVHEEKNVETLPAKLFENHWTDKSTLGKQVKCAMAIGYKDNAAGAFGPYVYSESYFAGIKVLNEQPVLVTSEEDVQLILQSTVPVISIFDNLFPQVRVIIPEEEVEKEEAIPNCKIQGQNKIAVINTEDLQSDHNNQCLKPIKQKDTNYTYTLKATQVQANIGANHYNLQLRLEVSANAFVLPAWFNYHLDPIIVNVQRKTVPTPLGRKCYAHCDPHMLSLDQLYYECQKAGEFVFYKHKQLPIQINTFHSACNYGHATCVCGVIVKVGGNAFFLYKCPMWPDNKRKSIKLIRKGFGCDAKDTIVVEQEDAGRNYKVTLPTGGELKISYHYYIDDYYMNVDLAPGVLDVGLTDGLCGNFNENKGDDTGLCDEWKVRDDTLYKHPEFDQAYPFTYCKCSDNNDITCTPSNVKLCKPAHEVTDELFKTWRGRKCDNGRKRRSAEPEIDDEIEELGTFDTGPIEEVEERTWDQCPDWDENTARQRCMDEIDNSGSAQACKETLEDTKWERVVEGAINNCIFDIKVGCNIDTVNVAVHTVVEYCKVEIAQNTSYWVLDGNGTASFPEKITSNVCLKDCSGHGDCINGTCSCHDGYIGTSCSDDLNTPPTVSEIENNKCNIRTRPCLKQIIPGDSFVNLPTLQCRVKHAGISITEGVKSVDSTETFNGEFNSFQQVTCIFAKSRRKRSIADESGDVVAHLYKISITNNGANYSEEVDILVYDDKCLDCNSTSMTCQLKNGTCRIDRECYAKGEVSAGNPCDKCDPDVSMINWTRTANSCQVDDQCFSADAVNPSFDCEVCKPAISNNTWTVQENMCHIEDACYNGGDFKNNSDCFFCQPSMHSRNWTEKSGPPCVNTTALPTTLKPVTNEATSGDSNSLAVTESTVSVTSTSKAYVTSPGSQSQSTMSVTSTSKADVTSPGSQSQSTVSDSSSSVKQDPETTKTGQTSLATFTTKAYSKAMVSSTSSPDGGPCEFGKHKVIGDSFWRSTNYNLTHPGGGRHCDDYIDDQQWYRFDGPTGNDMPQECPVTKRCGTYFPIWLNGSLPSPDEGEVLRDACVKFVGCCDMTKQVSIKNCGEFNVYKFERTSGCCPCGYCIGNGTIDTATTKLPTSTVGEAKSVMPTTESTTTTYNKITTEINEGPCEVGKHSVIGDSFWRSTNYNLAHPGGGRHCDDYIDDQQWYRFDGPTGNDMPQECPITKRCGTYFPIWLNGSLPSPDEGEVVRDACVKFVGCCDMTKQVSIKNCGEFNVYKFERTSGCCPCGYCIGNGTIDTATTKLPTSTVGEAKSVMPTTESTKTTYNKITTEINEGPGSRYDSETSSPPRVESEFSSSTTVASQNVTSQSKGSAASQNTTSQSKTSTVKFTTANDIQQSTKNGFNQEFKSNIDNTESEGTPSYYYAIGACAGILLLITVAVTVIIMKKKKAKYQTRSLQENTYMAAENPYSDGDGETRPSTSASRTEEQLQNLFGSSLLNDDHTATSSQHFNISMNGNNDGPWRGSSVSPPPSVPPTSPKFAFE